MTDKLESEEIYGVRFFIEIALDDEERLSYLAKSLAEDALKSDLCPDDISNQELIYAGKAFLKGLALGPESVSRKIADRLKYSQDGYSSGLLKNLDPKLGEVAQFVQNVKKTKVALKEWNSIDPNIPEPGILPVIGDCFSYQVENALANESLIPDVGKMNKLFRMAFKGKVTVEAEKGFPLVLEKPDDGGRPELHSDTIDLWMKEYGIEETHREYCSQQFYLLEESFSEHLENYEGLNALKGSRKRSLNIENGNRFL